LKAAVVAAATAILLCDASYKTECLPEANRKQHCIVVRSRCQHAEAFNAQWSCNV